jgi:hypothetical protein
MDESDVDEAEGLGESMGETAAEDSVESTMLRRREALTGRGMAVEAMVGRRQNIGCGGEWKNKRRSTKDKAWKGRAREERKPRVTRAQLTIR